MSSLFGVLCSLVAAAATAKSTAEKVQMIGDIDWLNWPPEQERAVVKLHPENDLHGNGRTLTVTRLSARPHLFHIQNLLSKSECKYIISAAKRSGLQSSGSRTSDKGSDRFDEVRTSSTSWLGSHFANRTTDPIMAAVEARIAAVAQMPIELNEGTQVVRYSGGESYQYHIDTTQRPIDGSMRLLTVLYFLNSVEVDGGGQTHFPLADTNLSALEFQGGAHGSLEKECELTGKDGRPMGVSVQPRRGDAILWYNAVANEDDLLVVHGSVESGEKLRVDEASLHAGCMLKEGRVRKWIGNNWFWNRRAGLGSQKARRLHETNAGMPTALDNNVLDDHVDTGTHDHVFMSTPTDEWTVDDVVYWVSLQN